MSGLVAEQLAEGFPCRARHGERILAPILVVENLHTVEAAETPSFEALRDRCNRPRAIGGKEPMMSRDRLDRQLHRLRIANLHAEELLDRDLIEELRGRAATEKMQHVYGQAERGMID